MSEALPFLLIIIPCRNEEKFIEKCLDSIIIKKFTKSYSKAKIVDNYYVK